MALRKTVCEWHQKRVGVQRIDDGWRNLALLHHQVKSLKMQPYADQNYPKWLYPALLRHRV
jgi:hypothetical protein